MPIKYIERFANYPNGDLTGNPVDGFPAASWVTTTNVEPPTSGIVVDGDLTCAGIVVSGNFTTGDTFNNPGGTVLQNNYLVIVAATFSRSSPTDSTCNAGGFFGASGQHIDGITLRMIGTGINNGRIQLSGNDSPSQQNYDTPITLDEPHAAWQIRRGNVNYEIFFDGASLGTGTFIDPDPPEGSYLDCTVEKRANSNTRFHFFAVDTDTYLDVPRAIYDGADPIAAGGTFYLWMFTLDASEAVTVYLQQGPQADPTYQYELATTTANSSGFKALAALTIPSTAPGGEHYYIRVVGTESDVMSDEFEVTGADMHTNGYVTCYNPQGVTAAGIIITVQLLQTMDGTPALSHSTAEISGTSNSSGLASVTGMVREAWYRARRGDGPWTLPFQTDDAATTPLPEILGMP